ncbi:unnamed protein product [Calicophoron daubneyi]|uniref:Mitochondrial folate transporter/carrier n=1 Tax=Calicophoron daubneyi TaxID=300641 RepID=A0AAV2TNX5_CALDB
MATGLLGQVQWPNLIAGLAGGAASTLVLHPLDLAKVRMQVNEGTGAVSYRPKTRGMFKTLFEVARMRGMRGLYLGLTPNLIGSSGSWGLYFLFYGALKSFCQDADPTRRLSTLTYLGCGALGGSLTLTIMNPMFVIKTRLCLQYECLARDPSLPGATTWNALSKLWRYEGVAGLYRGYLAGLLSVSHGAIQFMLYEQMRNLYNHHYRHRTVNSKLTALEYLTFASLSKLAAASLTYPYQVIRSRMQDEHRRYKGILDVIRVLWRGEGVRGFYKGLVPNLLRVTPACAITFLVYEYTLDFLRISSPV